MNDPHCRRDIEGHCITCSDEIVAARIVHIDREAGLALVALPHTTEEVDVTLVDMVSPGDLVLVHGGVVIGRAEEVSDG